MNTTAAGTITAFGKPATNVRVIASTLVLFAILTTVPRSHAGTATGLMSGTSIAKAIMKYFGREGTQEATEYLARNGGRELAEQISARAIKEGGKEAADQISRLAAKHGPDVLAALDNAPSIAPVLSALDELPESQVRAALTQLSAGAAGRELAETVARVGSTALKSELKHPGVGGLLAKTLGDDGAKLATELTTDQAVAVARHADDLAKLPTSQRTGVLSLMRSDAERMAGFLARFAEANPGKTLFTAATTAIVLAEPDRILGGDEIVFDADGNPVLISKSGLAGRTMQAGGQVIAEVSNSYIRPLFLTGLAFLVTSATLFLMLKLWHSHQQHKAVMASAASAPETIEGKVTKKDD